MKKLKKMAIALFAITMLFSACSSKKDETHMPVQGYVGVGGAGIVPIGGEKTFIVNYPTKYLCSSPDSKYIIVITENGQLYYTDQKNTVQNTIIESGFTNDVESICNKGFFYNDKQKLYRVSFDDNSILEVGDCEDSIYSTDGSLCLFSANGEIFKLSYDVDSPESIGTYNKVYSPKMLFISNDGTVSIWAERFEGESYRIYICDNDNVSEISETSPDGYDIGVKIYSTFDNKKIVMIDENEHSVFIKYRDKDVQKIKLPGQIDSFNFCTANGNVKNESSSTSNSYYISVEGFDESFPSLKNVYYLSDDGLSERVLTDIIQFGVYKNKIYYIDEDMDLYTAELDKYNAFNQEKIASDTNTLTVSGNGEYVYYMKNCEDDSGELHCYNSKTKDVQKISLDVYCMTFSLTFLSTIDFLIECDDNKSIYYYKNMEIGSDPFYMYGELFLYDSTKHENKKIGSDVLLFTASSGYVSGNLNKNNIVYQKYVEINNGDVISDLMYYNGENTFKLASDIEY